MKRVIAVLALVLVSCAQRTKNLDFHTSVKFSLDVAELVDVGEFVGGVNAPKTAKNSLKSENGNNDRSVTDKGGPNETNPDDEKSTYSTPKKSDKEIISETIFYVFDQNGVFQSKNMFSGSDNFDVDFKQNGPHTVYVLCNVSEIIDLPATPSKEEIESLVIPHRTDYKRLPFAGKTEVDVLPSQTPQIKIKLNRINSAIKLENRSADRIDIEKMTVSGLPSMGYVFTPDEAVQGVTYNETAEAQTDADGNAVIYSFMVPKEKIAEVKLEADAKLKDETNPDADNIATVAPLSFLGSLEAGKRATALIGYLENGTLRVGSPENWGNVGKYQLTDDVLIQVIGGTFNDKGELRAYSGGCEFSFIIVSKSGEATLEPVSATDWIHLNDNVMTVDPNTTDSERRCRIAVKVGGQNVGIFTVVQGNAIKFTGEGDTTVEDDKVVVVGGKSTPAQVKFTISDAELAETEIVPVDNGENGVTVTVDRAAKSLTATLIAMVDASEVPEEGVSVPVNFVDLNGSVQATITFVQRPAHIVLNPNNLTMAGGGESKLSVVTTEGEAVWAVKSVTDESGSAISWLTATTTSSPAASGNNLTIKAQANNATAATSRTAYVRVESRATTSKPLVVEQEAVNTDPGEALEINGIIWSKYNLANPKQAVGGATFAKKLPSECTGTRKESHGKLYQWGINVAWSSTDPLSSTPSGATFNTTIDPTDWNDQPCPEGWRFPTDVEFSNLLNNSSYTRDGGWGASDYGYVTVTLNNDSSKKLEFPAVGQINSSQKITSLGEFCCYWLSSAFSEKSDIALAIWINKSLQNIDTRQKTYANSVRCVKGSVKDSQVDPFETVAIGGVEWMPLNLADAKQSSGGATFATKLPSQCFGNRAESFGKHYVYGRNIAWEFSEPAVIEPWNITPCPNGYHLPTYEEFYSLINNSTVTRHGGWSYHDSGWIEFTSGSKSLEFPAAGLAIKSGDGYDVTSDYREGIYWMAMVLEAPYYLSFTQNELLVRQHYGRDDIGYSIRCVKGDKPDTDPFKTVNIGGIEWMQLNLANPRQASGGATFAKKRPHECTSGVRLESHGKFYQWGVNVAWKTTGASASGATPSGTWQTSTSYPSDWNISPCPDGYRLPTGDEFRTLMNASNRKAVNYGNWSESDYGYVVFTSKADPSQQLFFTAVGYRDDANGSLVSPGEMVTLWAADGYYLKMTYDSTNVLQSVGFGSLNKRNGMSVRCVRQ